MQEFYGMTRRTMIVALLLLAPLLADEKGIAEKSVAVEMRPVTSATARPRLLFPRLPITLTREPVEGIPALSDAGVFASVRAGGKNLQFALDAVEGTFALGKLIVVGGKSGRGKVEAGARGGFQVLFRGAKIDGVVLNLTLHYRGTKMIAAYAEPARHRRGTALLDGVRRDVILVDGNGDGKFNGEDDRWIALRQEKTRKVLHLQLPATYRCNEPQAPFAADGTALMVRSVAADGSKLELVRATPTTTMKVVLARRYLEYRSEYYRAFAMEGDAFIKRSGIDAKRERGEHGQPWVRESLKLAQERARKTGKPLLVVHYTETNDWWWRYLYYTFRDRKVDGLLRQFTLAAIDAEKDSEHAYQTSGARGLPAFEFFTPDAERISFNFRARDEKGEARNLGRASFITGWQRPVDFEVNLRRVLDSLKNR
jgi:hypothetical protein